MARRQIKCPACGRVFYTDLDKKVYCDRQCQDMVMNWAKAHGKTWQEAREYFMAQNRKLELQRVANQQARKKKKLEFVQCSSHSGVWRYVEVIA